MENDYLENLKRVAEAVALKYNLLLVVLFGSRATGFIHAKSDTDFAVLADFLIPITDLIQIGYEFDKVSGVAPAEVVDLKIAPPLLLKAVATEGVLLYEKVPHIFAEFQLRALRHYFDTKPLRKFQEKALLGYLQNV